MRLVVMASGSGSTFEYVVKQSRTQSQPFDVLALVSDNPKSKSLERAISLKVPSIIVPFKEYSDHAAWDHALAMHMMKLNPDWICLTGFLRKIGPEMIRTFPKKIINTHPSLLPKYGGAGMYGSRVHEAVWKSGDAETGVTLHVVDENFDTGPILAQRKVSCQGVGSPQEIEERVKAVEKEFLFEYLSTLGGKK